MSEHRDSGSGQILIRQAGVDDLDRIVPLFDAYRQFYKQPPDPVLARSFLTARLRNNQSVIFLALDSQGSSPLGFTQLYPSFSSGLCRPIYILNDLFVVPEARRRKVGYLLLQAAAEFGRKTGAARLTLSTAFDNATARALYEFAGWRRDTVFCVYNLLLG
ncbi:MAG TPA: GNAT family N-acetyltransferase [Bryobacteraceae bacterium]|jgi:GNAT superfamily N-acetyltransferase